MTSLLEDERCDDYFDGGGYEMSGNCELRKGHDGPHKWPEDPYFSEEYEATSQRMLRGC